MDTQWFEASVFGEDVISLTDKWTVSVELRYDKVDLGDMFSNTWQNIHNLDPNNPSKTAHKTPEPIDGHVSPSVATAYNLDKDTTIRASYQHGFRAPDALYCRLNLAYGDSAGAVCIDIPQLKIETLDSFELNFP